MKKILALALALMMMLALAACGGAEAPAAEAPAAAPAAPAAAPEAAAPAAPAAEATWADYQAYLIEKAGANAPDLAEFEGQVYAINSWEELDQTVSPWDQMFTTIGLSTWEEFAAGVVKEPAVMGTASGEAAAAPAAEGEASGEPSGEAAPASANEAHGGTPGAVSQADYQAYLKAWLTYEQSVNSNMDDEAFGQFSACIDAMDFASFPGDMLFNGMLNTGVAMTFDQFVAANGVY